MFECSNPCNMHQFVPLKKTQLQRGITRHPINANSCQENNDHEQQVLIS